MSFLILFSFTITFTIFFIVAITIFLFITVTIFLIFAFTGFLFNTYGFSQVLLIFLLWWKWLDSLRSFFTGYIFIILYVYSNIPSCSVNFIFFCLLIDFNLLWLLSTIIIFWFIFLWLSLRLEECFLWWWLLLIFLNIFLWIYIDFSNRFVILVRFFWIVSGIIWFLIYFNFFSSNIFALIYFFDVFILIIFLLRAIFMIFLMKIFLSFFRFMLIGFFSFLLDLIVLNLMVIIGSFF